jgi:hypothetical protein
MTLPTVVEFRSPETPLNLASRLALANGYASMSQFLESAGIKRMALSLGDPVATDTLAFWSGIPASDISRYSHARSRRGAPMAIAGATFSKGARSLSEIRLCPNCIAEDVVSRDGDQNISSAWCRAYWATKSYENCTTHRRPILAVASDGFDYGDFSLALEANLDQVIRSASEPWEPVFSAVDAFIEARVQDASTTEFLDSLEVHVVIDLAYQLGRFLQQYQEALPGHLSNSANLTWRDYGLTIASRGEDAMRDAVVAVIQHVRPPDKDGFFYGNFGRWLRRNSKKTEFTSLVEFFQDVAERNQPFDVGDVCFVSVRRRHLHSVTSASLAYGLSVDRVERLMIENGLLRGDPLSAARSYFGAEAAHDILSQASEALDSKQVMEILGISERVFHQFVRDGLIPRVEQRQEGRIYTRVLKSDVIDFQERIFREATVGVIDGRMLSLVQAVQLSALQMSRILELIIGGSLKPVTANPDHLGKLSAIFLEKAAVLTFNRNRFTALASRPADTLSLKEVASLMRLQKMVVGSLAENGWLGKVRISSFKKQRYVAVNDVISFTEKYVSTSEVARTFGVHTMAVSDQLASHKIFPVPNLPKDITSFFLRSDLIGISLERRTPPRSPRKKP